MKRRVLLNIAEKPSIARLIAYHLSDKSFDKLPSKSKYNPTFSFNLEFEEEEVEMIVTSVTGHVTNLKFKDEFKNWAEVNPKDLLSSAGIEEVVDESKKAVVENLKEYSQDIDDVVLWLDCDKEGEAISYEVLDVCNEANQNGFEVHRAKFSAATKRDIVNAFGNLEKPNENLRFSVDARREIDLRIGAALTRLQTLTIQEKFQGVQSISNVVSYGPCQFPTLGFVVKRDQAISRFVPQDLFKVNLVIKGLKFERVGESGVELNKDMEALYERLVSQDDLEAEVTLFSKLEVERRRPYPLTTVNLQRIGSSRLNMSTFNLMKTAERLYTRGYISYPRTETNMYDFTISCKNLVERLTESKSLGKYAKKLMDGDFRKPRNGSRSDKAHPPIHPVKADDNTLTRDEIRVYDFIARHFLAQCSEDAKIEETTLEVTTTTENETFRSKSQKILEKNYMDVYDQNFKETEIEVFEASEGDLLKIDEVELKKSKTRPPNFMTESELVGLMEANSIGTDATIHEHIKKIFDRGYAEKKGRTVASTQLGRSLVEAYQDMDIDLYEPELRSEMEADLERIAEGEKSKDEIVSYYVDKMIGIYDEIEEKRETINERIMENFGGNIAKKIGEENEPEEGDDGYSRMQTEFDVTLCPNCNPSKSVLLKADNRRVMFKCGTGQCSQEFFTVIGENSFFSFLEDKCKLSGTNVIQYKGKNKSTQIVSPFSFNYELNKKGDSAPEIVKREPRLPCFKCNKIGCKFSNKVTYPLKKCNKCGNGNIFIQSKRDGGHFLACDRFPKCRNAGNVPEEYEWILPTEEYCYECSDDGVRKVKLKMKSWDKERTVCLGCDKELADEFDYQQKVLQ